AVAIAQAHRVRRGRPRRARPAYRGHRSQARLRQAGAAAEEPRVRIVSPGAFVESILLLRLRTLKLSVDVPQHARDSQTISPRSDPGLLGSSATLLRAELRKMSPGPVAI